MEGHAFNALEALHRPGLLHAGHLDPVGGRDLQHVHPGDLAPLVLSDGPLALRAQLHVGLLVMDRGLDLLLEFRQPCPLGGQVLAKFRQALAFPVPAHQVVGIAVGLVGQLGQVFIDLDRFFHVPKEFAAESRAAGIEHPRLQDGGAHLFAECPGGQHVHCAVGDEPVQFRLRVGIGRGSAGRTGRLQPFIRQLAQQIAHLVRRHGLSDQPPGRELLGILSHGHGDAFGQPAQAVAVLVSPEEVLIDRLRVIHLVRVARPPASR